MNDIDNAFQKDFQDKQNKSKNKLEDFLKEPGEKQIHDLRTSIRRLEATYFILPNSCKRKKTDNFVSSYKSLLKKNSFIRDSDIIIKKLLENGFTEKSEIIKHIVKQKNKKLKNTIKYAKNISELKFVNCKNINTDKIIKKYEKMISLFVTKIQDQIPIVISDKSKVKELHTMRKTTKKLRYILEIEPNQSYQHLIDNMKLLQKVLGKIHDCDITIDFLRKHSKNYPELKHVIQKERESRSQSYNKLVESLSMKIE